MSNTLIKWFRLRLILSILITSSLLGLQGCSGQSFPGSQLLESIGSIGNKSAKPAPLKKLKPVSNTINARQVWQVKTGAVSRSSQIHPFISGQAVIVAGGVQVSAWNKNTGKLLWKTKIGELISAGVNGGSTANGQQIYLGTANGNAVALDALTGKTLWVERLDSEILSVSRSQEQRVAFRTIDGKLHGLNSATGELVWQQSQRTPALTLHGASVPVIVGGRGNSFVICGFDNGKIAAYALQSGAPVWEATLAEPRGQSELDRMVDIDGKLKVLGKALFASALNGVISGIDLEKGQMAWAKRFSSSTGVDADRSGLYSSDSKGNIWKFRPQSGEPVWKMDDLLRREPTTPILFDAGLLIVGDKQGNLHWINAINGQFVARLKGDPAGYSVAPVVEGNAAYVFGKSGMLTKLSR